VIKRLLRLSPELMNLYLNSARQLNSDTLKLIIERHAEGDLKHVNLSRLKTIEPKIMSQLAQIKCEILHLGLEQLNSEDAQILSQAQCKRLELERVRIEPEAAEKLLTYQGTLRFNNLLISEEVAAVLTKGKFHTLDLSMLRRLHPEVLYILKSSGLNVRLSRRQQRIYEIIKSRKSARE